MRLDKYLKESRILKRRSVAQKLAANERVLLNGKPAKPAREVKVDDILEVRFGNRILTVKVLSTENNTKEKKNSESMYEVIKEEEIEYEPEEQ